jgi:hypothetical protein
LAKQIIGCDWRLENFRGNVSGCFEKVRTKEKFIQVGNMVPYSVFESHGIWQAREKSRDIRKGTGTLCSFFKTIAK